MRRRSFLREALGSVVLLAQPGPSLAAAAEPEPAAEVGGTALGPPPGPTAQPVPLAGVTVLLLPRSDELLAGLESLRARSRDSLGAYRSAIPEMRRLVDSAAEAARDAGPGTAVHGATVDASGRFSLSGVRPGAWILIASTAVRVDRRDRDRAKESGTFLPQPRLVGYDRVSLWLQVLTVEAGRRVDVALTDRNVWFEGVEEETATRERTPTTGTRRRSAR